MQDLIATTEPGAKPIAASISKIIEEALSVVPADKTGAAVGYVDETGAIHGVIALKLGGAWTLWANADYHTSDKHFTGTAGVRFTW